MRSGTKKYERDLAKLQRELAKTPRRPRKQKGRDDPSDNTAKSRPIRTARVAKWTPPSSKTAIVSTRPVTRQGQTFHMAFTTVRVDEEAGSRLSQHQQYIERPDAAATLDGVAGRDVQLEPVVGYDAEARPGRYHQRYLETGNVELHGRRPISFGTIGDSPEQRDQFWRLVELTSRRNGITQHRIICELPCELSPAGHAEIVQEFSKVFTERELPFWCVVHAPDKHNDARNFHAHIVYYHRPSRRLETGEWDFAYSVIEHDKHDNVRRKFPFRRPFDRRTYEKDVKRIVDGKTVLVPGWYSELRQRYCKIMNDALAKAGVSKRYTPLSYASLGVKKRPSKHLGPNHAALERAGVQTLRGSQNGAREIEFAATRIPAASFAGRVQIEAFIAQAEKLRLNPIPPAALPAVLAAEQATRDYILQTESFLELVGRAHAHDTYQRRRDTIVADEIAAMRRPDSKVHPADRSRHYTALLNQRREVADAVDVAKINQEARRSLDDHARALGAARTRLNQMLFNAEQAIADPDSLAPIASTKVPALASSQIKVQAQVTPATPAANPAPAPTPSPAPPVAETQRPTASATPPAGAEIPMSAQPPAPINPARTEPKAERVQPTVAAPSLPSSATPSVNAQSAGATRNSDEAVRHIGAAKPTPSLDTAPTINQTSTEAKARQPEAQPEPPIVAAAPAAAGATAPTHVDPATPPPQARAETLRTPSVSSPTPQPQHSAFTQPISPPIERGPATPMPAPNAQTPRNQPTAGTSATTETSATRQPAVTAKPALGEAVPNRTETPRASIGAAPQPQSSASARPVEPVPTKLVPAPEAHTPPAQPAAATTSATPTASPARQPAAMAKPTVGGAATPSATAARSDRVAPPKAPAVSSQPPKPDREDGIRAMAARHLIKLPRDRFPDYVTIYKHSTLPLQQQQTFAKLFTTDVDLLKRRYRDSVGALHHLHSMALTPEQEAWRNTTAEMLRNGINAVQRIAVLNGWAAHPDPAQWRETVASDNLLSGSAWHFKFRDFAALPKAVQELALARRADIAKRLGHPIPGTQPPKRPAPQAVPAATPQTPRSRPDRGR